MKEWIKMSEQKPTEDDDVRLSSRNSSDGDFGATFYVSENNLFYDHNDVEVNEYYGEPLYWKSIN